MLENRFKLQLFTNSPLQLQYTWSRTCAALFTLVSYSYVGFFGYHWYDFGYDFGIFKSIKQKYEHRNFLPRTTHFSLRLCFWLNSHLRVLSCHMHLSIRINILNSFEHWLKCYLRLYNLFSDSGKFVGSFRHTLAIVGKFARGKFRFDVFGEFNDGMFFG